jgi:hypothetical protein
VNPVDVGTLRDAPELLYRQHFLNEDLAKMIRLIVLGLD